MSTLVTRAGKGSPLTHNEVDDNFTNLNTDKVEKTSAAITGGTINGTTIGATTPAAGTFTTLTAQTEVLKGTGQNLVQYSEQIDNAYWSKSNVTVSANATTSPTGTSTADLIYPSSTGVNRVFFKGSALTTGLTYTSSIYAKAGGLNFVYLALETGAGLGAAWFNLSTGAVGTVTSGYTASIESVGSGWYRCSVTRTASSNFFIWGVSDADNSLTATTSGTNGVYVWGVQLELASSVGTYTLTTTTAVYGTPTLSFSGVSTIGLESNGSLFVQPAGTGALQAQATTSSAVGGNARGTNSVDWQTARSTATRVASGAYSTISGGQQHTSSGTGAFVGGGYANSVSAYEGAIVGGSSNTATNFQNFIGGGTGNNVSGSWASIVAGSSNSAAGYYNFIGGGFTNSATSASAVTTQSGTMNATTAVTLSGSNASIKVGQYITGTSIAANTYVAAISGTSLTLSQVASGSSTSTLSFYTPHGVVVGGGNNQATGSYSFIGGGGDAGTAGNRNSVTSDWGVVVGGFKNTIPATGIANTIGGGYGNTISSNTFGSFIGGGGTYNGSSNPNTISNSAAVIAGGINNSNSSFVGFIGGGFNNTANGSDYSTIVNGQGNTANSSYSFISGGYGGTTRGVIGYHVFPASNAPVSTTQGVQQASLLVLGVQTTDATATVLRSNQSAAGTTNQVILPNNSAYYFKGSVIANVTGAANGASWSFEGAIMRGANAASTVLIDTPSVNRVASSAGATAWVVALSADTTNGGLAVTVTGAASTTIRWVCKAETTEVTF